MSTRPNTPAKVGHVDVAAYVLGILDEPDEAAFTRHFNRCPQCRAEYRELSDLPMLLDQLKSTPVQPKAPSGRQQADAPTKRVLAGVLDQVNTARRARRRTVWLAAAAAVVFAVTVPVVVLNVGGSGGGEQVAGPTVTVSVEPSAPTETGTDVVAGARTVTGRKGSLSATIGIEPEAWGTRVNLELRGITGPMVCRLLAVSNTNDVQPVTSWTVPREGFGLTTEPLRIQANVGLPLEDIEVFSVRADDGTVLLDVPL